MFKKPKRSNFRQRRKDHDDSEDEQEISQHDKDERVKETSSDDVERVTTGIRNLSSPIRTIEDEDLRIIPVAPQPKVSTTTSIQPKSTLSFMHHEEDEEEIQVKKSSYSKRMTKQLEKERKLRLKVIGEKEKLKQQQEQQKLEEERIQQENNDDTRIEDKSEDVEVIQIPVEDNFSDDSGGESDGTSTGINSLRFRPINERGASSVIPDAKTIFALKKQRQSRKHADEFIALTTASGDRVRHRLEDSGDEEEDNDTDRSRLTTKKLDQYEEEFNEEEEDRIEFDSLKSKEKERQMVQEAIESAQLEFVKKGFKKNNQSEYSVPDDDEEEEDEEDEVSRWEREQIMKGVGSASVINKSRIEAANMMQVSSSPTGFLQGFDEDDSVVFEGEIPAWIQDSFEAVTIDDVLDLIQERVDEKKERISYFDRQLTNLSNEEKLLNQDLERLESQQKDLEQQRKQLHEKLKEIENNHEVVDLT